ncbi:ectonucleotide pyrophosphatase/phosphodiesterase family member 3-like isoform X2 [Xenia sp. Carnegie-2017]|uniref:ectonucleotide pyrophosphatase/phosphodiesterase family member 3-like isoform X2 n=1 Tax=Xenia sp. Carnegie-2017 TaxID=2897299 RepID=UPI001F04008A|nr:ectonucleotide pyrophosphatase/phosphodiesterase family member 3-like isoform X2 [Xenia sp. Carnegie-2017]
MNMSDSVNVIFLSDHGMTNTHCKNIKFMDEYEVKPSSVKKSVSGAVLAFRTKNPDDREEVFNKIKCVDETFHSFYKEDLPKRMHFSNSKRIDDIIVLAELGRLVAIDSEEVVDRCSLGTHGYDPIIPDMWTIFMARGPSFLKNKVVDHFSNVEVYNLLSEVSTGCGHVEKGFRCYISTRETV